MKPLSIVDGLAARRKAIRNKTPLLILSLFCICTTALSQDHSPRNPETDAKVRNEVTTPEETDEQYQGNESPRMEREMPLVLKRELLDGDNQAKHSEEKAPLHELPGPANWWTPAFRWTDSQSKDADKGMSYLSNPEQ